MRTDRRTDGKYTALCWTVIAWMGFATLSFVISGQLSYAADNRNGVLYTATAYSDKGITASGQYTHRHIVAADPDILPLGTRIRVRKAGRHSGEYVVADTGAKVQGRKIDIYMPSEAAARKFGVRKVRIKILELGDGTRQKTKQADVTVKQDVANEVAKNAEGSAATEDDIAAKNAREKEAAAKASAASEPKQPASDSPAPAHK
jgi:3D (Asp-Asp-Asp) domain-containing protein